MTDIPIYDELCAELGDPFDTVTREIPVIEGEVVGEVREIEGPTE